MKTVIEVITATADYFAKSKIENPRLNIEHLLAHVLGKKRMDLYLEFDRALTEECLVPLRDLVRRRAAGEPLQYLMESVEFLDHTLRCDARGLIPRPETEQLCELLIQEGKNAGCPWARGHILDVGTGSGCIALILAAAFPDARVTAVDVSEDALSLSLENAKRLGLAGRVDFLKSDLLAAVERPVDLIVANLPYIPSGEIAGLEREVLREPLLALDGGEDGLVLVRALVAQAREKLHGRLALELHISQPEILADEMKTQNFRDIKIREDYTHRPRFLFATYG